MEKLLKGYTLGELERFVEAKVREEFEGDFEGFWVENKIPAEQQKAELENICGPKNEDGCSYPFGLVLVSGGLEMWVHEFQSEHHEVPYCMVQLIAEHYSIGIIVRFAYTAEMRANYVEAVVTLQ